MAETTRPNDGVQTISFHSLPLELRQSIFQYAATGSFEHYEIEVTYTLNDPSHEKLGTLHSQALSVLGKLRKVSKRVYEGAVDCLTSPRFRWVFNSNSQPHKYLILALRKSVDQKLLARIGYLRLSRVTFLDHALPAPFVINNDSRIHKTALDRAMTTSAYIKRLSLSPSYGLNHYIAQVNRDIGYAMMLLPHTTPTLRRLDIELDVADCLSTTHDFMNRINHKPNSPPHWPTKNQCIIYHLGAFANAQVAGGIELHLLWKDYGVRARMPNHEFSDDFAKALQESFAEALRRRLSFKSVTSHA